MEIAFRHLESRRRRLFDLAGEAVTHRRIFVVGLFRIGTQERMFDWNDLKFFLELARQGRLMPAARRLKVDHTTVSRRISELERDLGIKIFDRKPNGFVLTEDGHSSTKRPRKLRARPW